MSYDTFLLYIIVLPEYVESTQILSKDSPMVTIWLHFFLQNENCSQEIVESSFRVRVDYCYSKPEFCLRKRLKKIPPTI